MIKNREELQNNGTLADVEMVNIAVNGNKTRFHVVVADGTDAIGCVTDQYDLVPNVALLDAVERAADVVGIGDLTVSHGYLNRKNGISKIALTIDGSGFTAPGDNSETMTELLIENNYAGRGRYSLSGGLLRMICSNGMTVFDAVASDSQIHIGLSDVEDWALDVCSVFAGKQSVITTLAEVAANAEWSPARFGEKLADTAPKRYRARLTEAVKSNVNDIGFNGWAAIQAVTEVATHDMKNTVTAQRWSNQAIEAVLKDIGRTWKTIEAEAGIA